MPENSLDNISSKSGNQIVQYSCAAESFRVDEEKFTLRTSYKNIVGYRFARRGGKDFYVPGKLIGGMLSADVALNHFTKIGTVDIYSVCDDSSERRFGRELSLSINEDCERLIHHSKVSLFDNERHIVPYITYGRNGVTIYTTDDPTKISKQIFGLVHLSLTNLTTYDRQFSLTGEFIISGSISADCKVSLVFRTKESELVLPCDLIESESIHQIYAIGKSDYRQSGFEVFVELDTLVLAGLMNEGRIDIFVQIQRFDNIYERRFGQLPKKIIDQPMKLAKGINIYFEKRKRGHLFLKHDLIYSTDSLNISSIKKIGKNKLNISGSIAIFGLDRDLLSISIVAKQRHGEKIYSFPAKPSKQLMVANYRNYDFSTVIDVKALSQKIFLEERFVDFFMEARFENFVSQRRLKAISKKFVRQKGEYLVSYKRFFHTNDVVFYLTRSACSLSLSLRESLPEDGVVSRIKEFIAIGLDYMLPRLGSSWLMYETYSETAQDNSFYFFKWVMENVESKKAYYVIRKNSRDLNRLKPYMSNILYYYSLKHLFMMLRSSLFVASQGRYHAFKFRPYPSYYKNRISRKKLVFLQHGVTAFKKSLFAKDDPSGGANLVIAVSPNEKSIIRKHWGYGNKDVVVTGFSRFDVLRDKSSKESPIILVMPTWRSWLENLSQEEFDKSDFGMHYRALLSNLESFSSNATIVFCLHIKLIKYAESWQKDFEYVNITTMGKKPVNELLMESSVLITDYSSVAWDFLYMAKPTIFYHFDLDRYLEQTGSFIDLKTELFGPIATRSSQVSELLTHVLQGKMEVDPKDHFRFIDQKNSQRIYQEIISKFGR